MTEKEQFLKHAAKVFNIGFKLKKIMLKKNLRIAKCECPDCKGWIFGQLVGRKNHLHMRCNNPACNIQMME